MQYLIENQRHIHTWMMNRIPIQNISYEYN